LLADRGHRLPPPPIIFPQQCSILTSHHTLMWVIAQTRELIIIFPVFNSHVSSLAHQLFCCRVKKEVYAVLPLEPILKARHIKNQLCCVTLQLSQFPLFRHVTCCPLISIVSAVQSLSFITSEINLKAAVISNSGIYWLVSSVAGNMYKQFLILYRDFYAIWKSRSCKTVLIASLYENILEI
jgi:hypothetical protein